jgi:hypothetical protein
VLLRVDVLRYDGLVRQALQSLEEQLLEGGLLGIVHHGTLVVTIAMDTHDDYLT